MTELPSEQDIREVLLEMAHSEDRTSWEDVKLQLFSLPESLLLPVLSEGAQDVDPMVRCQAGTLLMDFQGGKHVELYRSLFRDPEDWVRWSVTGKAATLQDVNLDEEVRGRLLTDEEVSVQVAATYYLDHVVGLPSIPLLLWLITHPTEPDHLGHTRHSAAEGSLISLLLDHLITLDSEVLMQGGAFQLGPMACRTTLKELPAGAAGEALPSLEGHRFHRTNLVAESPLGCFSVDVVAHLNGQGNGLRSVSPSTYRFWGISDEPPPLRVEP